MKWLNLELSKLRSPEYIGSDPIHRATWLNLTAYCAEQENGGIIPDCLNWKSRMWEQSAGVTKEEVGADSMLWTWDGNSVKVWAYPVEKEAEVQAKREGGYVGGKASGKARKEASLKASSEPMLEAELEAELERKGKEGKGIGKEEKGMEAVLTSFPEAIHPSLDEVKTKCQFIGLAEWRGVAWWNEMQGCDWLDYRHRKVVRWQPILDSVKLKWEAEGRPSGPPSGSNGNSQKKPAQIAV